MTTQKFGIPTQELIQSAPEHVAWEFVALLAAAHQMAMPHRPPRNHQAQEAFLVHLRNLAEFFHSGVAQFKANLGVLVSRRHDNIFAVDLCESVKWDETPFHKRTRLRRAIDKTLFHITYSRNLRSGVSEIDIAFDGRLHLHGTIRMIRHAWDGFIDSLRPDCRAELDRWVGQHSRDMLPSLNTFDVDFERMARGWSHWRFNETPDGLIPESLRN